MAERTTSHQLALMARSGLMTHVAELTPPIAADAAAQFRADVSRQARNVMALASGRFALCLEVGQDTLDTSVPHRLVAIDGSETPPSSEAQPAPRRIEPPSLRATTRPDTTKDMRPRPSSREGAPARSDASADGARGRHTPDSSREPDQAADLVGRLAELPAAIAIAERRAADRIDRQMEALARIEARFDTLDDRVAATRDRAEQIEAAEARTSARLSDLETRLADGIEAAFSALGDATERAHHDIGALSERQAADAARSAEGLAAVRLGLRAVNDRLAGIAGTPREETAGAEEPYGTTDGAGHGASRVTTMPAAEAAAARGMPPAMRPRGEGRELVEIRGAIQTLLARLDRLESDKAETARDRTSRRRPVAARTGSDT